MNTLSDLECPFNWKLENEVPTMKLKDLIDSVESKTKSIITSTCDFYKFDLSLFAENMLLCYLSSQEKCSTETKTDGIKKALDILKNWKEKNYELENCDEEPLFQKIKKSLQHVIFACEAHIYDATGDSSKVIEILQLVPPVSSMKNEEKAAFEGIKAQMFLEYMSYGYELAKNCAMKARDLDPDEAEWYFMVGKAIGRIHHGDKYKLSLVEQKKNLEKAVELRPCPIFMCFLAQTISKLIRKEKSPKRDLENNTKALTLYEKSLEMHSNCPQEMFRLARHLVSMPPPFKDVERALDLIKICLETAFADQDLHKVAGNIYEYDVQDYNKALYHYKHCGLHGIQKAVKLKYKISRQRNYNYEAYNDLIKGLGVVNKLHHRIIMHKEIGSYFLFRKDDLRNALKHFKIVIENNEISLLQSFTNCASLPTTLAPCDLVKILIDEVRLDLEEKKLISKDDRDYYEDFLNEMRHQFPDLLNNPPKRGVESIKKSMRI